MSSSLTASVNCPNAIDRIRPRNQSDFLPDIPAWWILITTSFKDATIILASFRAYTSMSSDDSDDDDNINSMVLLTCCMHGVCLTYVYCISLMYIVSHISLAYVYCISPMHMVSHISLPISDAHIMPPIYHIYPTYYICFIFCTHDNPYRI